MILSEESTELLWPGQTALQLKEGHSLMLPAGLEYPWSVQSLEQRQLFPRHKHSSSTAAAPQKGTFFAEDCDGNMRRIACILPIFYIHVHS